MLKAGRFGRGRQATGRKKIPGRKQPDTQERATGEVRRLAPPVLAFTRLRKRTVCATGLKAGGTGSAPERAGAGLSIVKQHSKDPRRNADPAESKACATGPRTIHLHMQPYRPGVGVGEMRDVVCGAETCPRVGTCNGASAVVAVPSVRLGNRSSPASATTSWLRYLRENHAVGVS